MSNDNYRRGFVLNYPAALRDGVTAGPDPLPLLVKIARRAKRVGECIEITTGLDKDGYGYVWHDKRKQRASRAVWTRINGPIPEGMSILHHCDNAPCVNPAHLYIGTQQQNMTDRVQRGRWKGGAPKGNKNGAKKK